MQQSPCWDTNSSSYSSNSLHFTQPKMKAHYYICKNLSLPSIVSLIHPVIVPSILFYRIWSLSTAFTRTCHLSLFRVRCIQSMHSHLIPFKMHFNIILLSRPRSSKWSPSFGFPRPNPACISVSLPICATWPTYPFDQLNNIWWGGKTMKLLTTQFPPSSCHILPLRPKYLPRHPILKHHQLMFFP